ncbi:Gldg family protein, partial [Planctomycetota bacterium]
MSDYTLRARTALFVLLLAANLFAFNVLLSSTTARVDLTEEREYTIGEVTLETLRMLPDQVTIHGYFSEKTHEKLAPLVPKIRDLLEEYRVRGEGRVLLQLCDPRGNEPLEKQAYQTFGVRPAAVPIETKWESGVQSIYFHVVVAFGDQHEVLEIGNLIEVERKTGGDVLVKLGNLEYQLTSTIQKVVRGFGTLESRLADLERPIEVRALLSGVDSVGEDAQEVRTFLEEKQTLLQDVVKKLEDRFTAGLSASLGDPMKDEAAKRDVQRFRIRPIRASMFDDTLLYVALVIRNGQRAELVPLLGKELSAADVIRDVEGSMRRLLPGALKRVGLVSDKPDIPPQQLMQMTMQGMQPPQDEFTQLRRGLEQSYEITDVKLDSGRPPLNVDVLLLLKPRELSEKARFALDQYLMLGGRAIVFLDRTELDEQFRFGLRLKKMSSGLDELLTHYGIKQTEELVQDDRNLTLPLKVPRQLGAFRVEEIRDVPYPWFLDVRGDSIDRENPVVGAVDRVGLMWSSPLTIDEEKQKDASYTKLLTSSVRAWTSAELAEVAPSYGSRFEPGYEVPEKTQQSLLAVAVEGKLTSAWK